ncbi:MAG: SLBB domain-containing protein [Bacteroidia bacterium]
MRKEILLYIVLLLWMGLTPNTTFAQLPPFGLPGTTTLPQGMNPQTGFPNTQGTNPQTGFPNTQGTNPQTGFPNTQGTNPQTGFPNTQGTNPQTGFPNTQGSGAFSQNNVPLPIDSTKQLPDYEQRMKELMEKGISEKQLTNSSQKTQDSLLNVLKNLDKSVSSTPIAPKTPKLPPNTAVFTRLDSSLLTIINQDTIRYLSYNQDSARFDTLIYLQQGTIKKKTVEELIASAVYGHHLFVKPMQLSKPDSTSYVPTDDYVIQPGDEFGVSAWNETYISEFLRVENDGTVSRQYVGKVFVGGLSYKDARTILEKAYSNFLPDGSRIKVRLVKNTRTQNAITIVGEVKQAGTFYLPPYATVFDALYAAGGITELGTVRSVYVKRSGKTIKTLDLYDYLIKGNIEPIYLKNGDYVFVPVSGDIVRIRGSVKRPIRYEMKENESIQDLVKFAGGFNSSAYTSILQITRLENDQKKILNVDFRNGGKLQDGDVVDVSMMSTELINFVEIKGSVIRPNTYQYYQGISLKELVRLAGGYHRTAYLDKAYIVRIPKVGKIEYLPVNLNTENPNLQPMDLLVVLDDTIFNKRKYIQVMGEVRKGGRFQTSPNMTLKDVLYLVEGLKENAKLENLELGYFSYKGRTEAKEKDINVVNPENNEDIPNTMARRISVTKDWQNDKSLDTILIGDYRYLKVYSKYDYIDEYKLNVFGSVRKKGTFKLNKTMTLKDVFYLVGGLKDDANYDNIELGYYKTGNMKDPNFAREAEKGEVPFVETKTRRISIKPNWEKDSTLDSIFVYNYRYVKVYSRYENEKKYDFSVSGAVRTKGTFQLNKTMTLKDVLYLVNGLKEDANYDNLELGYYEYLGNENDPNINLDMKEGTLPFVETQTRRLSIQTDWQKDPELDTILLYKYRYLKVYSRYEEYKTFSIQTSGAFKKARTLQLNPTLTLKDAIYLSGGLKENADLSSIELRYYKGYEDKDISKINLADLPKESATLRIISANEDWRNDPSLDTIKLEGYNFIKIYDKEEFVLNRKLQVSGVVQQSQTITLSKSMTLKDVFYLCEGLKVSEETSHWIDLYYYVPVQERGNLNMKAQINGIRRLLIGKDWRNDNRLDSILVFPFEKIVVHGQNEFLFTGDAEIKGVVNSPGRFNVAPKMTLKDVLYLSGGTKLETDYHNIEISRVLKLENTNGQIETTPVIMQKLVISQDWQNDEKIDSVFIYPFDIIYVRPNPNFKLQQNVSIEGEITVPGEYPKLRPNERISSLVKRAGGVSKVGFPAGAKLIRKANPIWEIQKQGRLQTILQKERIRFLQTQEKAAALDRAAALPENPLNSQVTTTETSGNQERKLAQEFNLGNDEQLITIQLDKAIKRPGGRYDLTLQEGDRIIIPPAKQTVEIRGNVLDSTSIVLFDKRNTSFKNYVNLAGGFGKRTDRNECVVIYPNGTSRKAERVLFWHKYPKVTDGAVIYVPRKPENRGQNFATQFAQFGPTLKELTADAMSILSLILLVRTLTQ